MKSVLFVAQLITSLLLIGLILIQARGTGFGRGSASGTSFSRRGLEKLVFRLTFVSVFLFVAISIALLFF